MSRLPMSFARIKELRDERDNYAAGPNQWYIQCPDDATALADAEAFDEVFDLLALTLPYVEDCAADPAYKPKRVGDLVARIKAVIARIEGTP